MKIKISNKGYKEKPTQHMGVITNQIKFGKSINVNIAMLAHYLESGYSVLLAELKEAGSTDKENIKSIELLAIDIDDCGISMLDMEAIVFKKIGVTPVIKYRTFSDVNMTKFRLIYKLESAVDANVYEALYKALKWKLGSYIDNQTCNANRIWAGTNKTVHINYESIDFSIANIIKLINNHEKSLKNKKAKRTSEILKGNNDSNKKYIKKEYKRDVRDMLVDNVDLKEYIEKHFGANFDSRNKSHCCLPSHTGDRSGKNLSVKGKMYTCFSCCGSGDIFKIAEMVYNTNDFSLLCFNIAEEYNIKIDEKMLGNLK